VVGGVDGGKSKNKTHAAFNEKQRFERIFAQGDARFLPEKTKWDLNEFCSNRFVLLWFLSSCRFSGRLTTEEEPYDCVRNINHSEAHTRLQQAAPFTRKYNVPRYNQTSFEYGAIAEVKGDSALLDRAFLVLLLKRPSGISVLRVRPITSAGSKRSKLRQPPWI
jgi:hypothetical protein